MNKSYLPIITPVVLFLTGVIFLGFTYYKNVSSKPAALSITSKYRDATVSLKNKELGKAPLDLIDLKPGVNQIKISTDNNSFTKDIILTEAAYTTISIDVGVSDKFSANQILWYDKANSNTSDLFVSSTPKDATVKINNKSLGSTPITISKKDLLESDNGEYTIVIEKDGYEAQKLNVKLENGFTLNVSSQLFLKPISKNTMGLESNSFYKIYNFIDPLIKSNQQGDWAQAIDYWLKTRGEAIIDTDSIKGFDYFIDSGGTLYSGDGKVLNKDAVTLTESKEGTLILIGYLSLDDNAKEMSTQASDTLSAITNSPVAATQNLLYEVTETGLGYLNVRDKPELTGEIVHQLNVGDTVKVLGQEGDWFKVQYKEGEEEKEAYAFSSYLKKSEPETP
ncbi:PEGA domain-containing protein [bacterium]|nr:PEGA domain-containing protein [bacterium]